ncbi:MAG: ABZJ_00895 family protein [Pseudomonadota bacterium]
MAHLGPLTARFFWVMLAGIVGVAALGLLLLGLMGLTPPAVLSVVPVMVAGFDAGRQFKRREGRQPSQGEGLKFALSFFAVNLVTSFVVLAGAFGTQGRLGVFLSALPDLAGPVAVFSLLFLVMIRVMMWFGGRSVD